MPFLRLMLVLVIVQTLNGDGFTYRAREENGSAWGGCVDCEQPDSQVLAAVQNKRECWAAAT